MIVAAALLALVAPAAAAATPFVPQALRDAATAHPTHEFRVIVQAQPGIPVLRLRAGVRSELNDEQSGDNRGNNRSNNRIEGTFSSISALAAELTGRQILLLAERNEILAITPDAPLHSGAAEPAPAPAVQISPPAVVALPGVTGSAVVGQTLTATDGVWTSGSPLTQTRRWQRCSPAGDACADVAGATAQTYLVGADDVGATIRVVVTATDTLGSATAASPVTGVAAAAPAPPAPAPPAPAPAPAPAAPDPPAPGASPAAPPTIAGSAREGEPLAAAGAATDAAGYQWRRCDATGEACSDIPGAVGASYTPVAADIGSTLRAAAGTLVSAPTAVVLPAPPVNVALPTVEGRLAAGSTLAATPGTWTSSSPLSYAYRWERCDAAGASCVEVATGPAYTPVDADAGSTLRVRVSVANDGGAAAAVSQTAERVAPSTASGFWSWQLAPYAVAADAAWTAVATAGVSAPAIAVVDSGVDPTLPGLAGAVVRQVTLTTLPQGNAADGYGHGSFVAQVAAGRGAGEAGAAPTAPIVSLDVMDDHGMARTSDVIAAADWIYAHKDELNIRVANFSLVGSTPSSMQYDPLDRALERLWFSGVVVVTASGNYAANGAPSDVPFAPANDPFVITVGAGDPAGTVAPGDDFAAPWSAYGHTLDGFAKPELGAPGRYLVAAVPTDSELYLTRPERVVAPGRLQLSGTSFAAPLVAGVAADLLALHPWWTPDQVKGALMLTASPPGSATPFALGVGEIDAAAALTVTEPPNPNAALGQFVVPNPDGSATPIFDAASWGTTAQANASWGTASWGTASWGTASWGTASWGTAYWSSASWGTASWGTSAEAVDNAHADTLPPAKGYWMRWPRK
jgi:serine protease AprX